MNSEEGEIGKPRKEFDLLNGVEQQEEGDSSANWKYSLSYAETNTRE